MLVGDGQFLPEEGTLFTGECLGGGGTIFPEGGQNSLVNSVRGGHFVGGLSTLMTPVPCF